MTLEGEVCPECNEGILKYQSAGIHDIYGDVFEYVCDHCDHTEYLPDV